MRIYLNNINPSIAVTWFPSIEPDPDHPNSIFDLTTDRRTARAKRIKKRTKRWRNTHTGLNQFKQMLSNYATDDLFINNIYAIFIIGNQSTFEGTRLS